MFSIFKKKIDKANEISHCEELANSANIEVVYQLGEYGGFLIFIDIENGSASEHFKHQDNLSKFVAIIEKRIAAGDFLDENLNMSDEKNLRTITGWKPKLDVPRAVFGKNNKPIFNWMGK